MKLSRNCIAICFLLCFGLEAGANGDQFSDLFKKNEQRSGGRLGVFALNLKTGEQISYRSSERFPICSTFKLSLVAHVLKRIDLGAEKLDRVIPYAEKDLLEYAPVTRKRLSERGMTVRDLCAAVLQQSDNTAANLLLATQGGPEGLTKFVRTLGDEVTRFDRREPDLNTPVAGKEFDTTTPAAMAKTMQKLVVGDVLSASSKALLKGWLLENATADKRFRSGVPKGWKVADKGGTGDNGATNDIGVLFTPSGNAIVLTAFSSNSEKPRPELEAELADVARVVSGLFHD